MKNPIYILASVVLLHACQEYYTDPDIANGNESIVIEGSITNDPGPYLIRISATLPYYRTRNQSQNTIQVSNALVIVEDNTGTADTCLEKDPGIYYTSPGGIRGEPGKTYTLLVQMPDGNIFQSEPSTMGTPAAIDSLYADPGDIQILEMNEAGGYFETSHTGISLYLDALPTQGEQYFYKIETEVVKETNHLEWRNGRPETTPGRPPLPTRVYCWETSILSNEKSLISSSSNASKEIRKRPIGFIMSDIHSETDKVNDPSYLVGAFAKTTVYSLSERIFEIFLQLNTQTDPANSIFDPIPTRIETNIFCANDPFRIVLGYFSASAISRRIRFFEWTDDSVSASIIDPKYALPVKDDCIDDDPPEFWINP